MREAIPTDIAPDAPSLGKSRRFWESSTKSLAQDIDQGAQSISISPDPFMQIENHGHTTPVLGMSSTSRVFGAKRSTDSIDLELPHRSAPATARRSDSALHRSKVLDSFVPEVSGYYTNFPDQCSDITDVMESEGLISLSNVEGTRTLRRSSFERRPTVEDAPAGAETIVPAAWRNSRIDSHISEEDNENTDSAAAHESLPVFLDVGPHELESSQIDGAGLSPKSQRPFSFTSPTG